MSIQNEAQEYLFGKGRIAVFERDSNGNTTKGIYVGNAPELKVSLSVEKIEHYESMSGKNLKDRDIIRQVGAEFSLVTENLSDENLALLIWGTKQTIASANNQEYIFPTVEVGGVYRIPDGFNITDLVIENAVGTPVALVEGVNYEYNEDFGTVKFLSLAGAGASQPFTAVFDRGGAIALPLFTGNRPFRFLQFEGVNIGNGLEEKLRLELYNCAFDPVTDLSFIGDDFGKFEMKGSLLTDTTREADANLGSYGRILKL